MFEQDTCMHVRGTDTQNSMINPNAHTRELNRQYNNEFTATETLPRGMKYRINIYKLLLDE